MGPLGGWVSSRQQRCVIFPLSCSSISSSWVRFSVLFPAAAVMKLESEVSASACAADTSRPLPVFVDIEAQDRSLPDGILLEHLKAFQALYREHCEVGAPMSLWSNSQERHTCQGFERRADLTLLTGHSRCYGQPSVHSCGDTLEIVLEVQ